MKPQIRPRANDTELRNKVRKAKLTPEDYDSLFYQLWGACSITEGWEVFEYTVNLYIDNKEAFKNE